ncbi:MAG TPA: hypothetical protein VJR87_10325, partial [Allosphingosinicella sp.]|nr:hypothetical protein [Allosphingosinicella sp.]
ASARNKLAQPIPLIVPKYLSLHTSLQKPVLNQNSMRLGIPKMSLQPRAVCDPIASDHAIRQEIAQKKGAPIGAPSFFA